MLRYVELLRQFIYWTLFYVSFVILEFKLHSSIHPINTKWYSGIDKWQQFFQFCSNSAYRWSLHWSKYNQFWGRLRRIVYISIKKSCNSWFALNHQLIISYSRSRMILQMKEKKRKKQTMGTRSEMSCVMSCHLIIIWIRSHALIKYNRSNNQIHGVLIDRTLFGIWIL